MSSSWSSSYNFFSFFEMIIFFSVHQNYVWTLKCIFKLLKSEDFGYLFLDKFESQLLISSPWFRSHRYDFYLVSQSVRQGTVSPTHYNVIDDNSDWSPEIIQRLTYKLTHMYFNWSVSIIFFAYVLTIEINIIFSILA